MERLLKLALLSLLCLFSCGQGDVDKYAVRDSVRRQMESFPESRLQDLYKSFFQDRFGPGHIIGSKESALEYILSELASADTLCGPLTEPCGWEGNYVRVNLSAIADSLVTPEQLTDALVSGAKEVKEEDIERWKDEWARILSIIIKEYPDLPDLDKDRKSIEDMLAAGQYACHHSEAYEKAYHPHYRIIGRSLVPGLLPEASSGTGPAGLR